MKLRSISIQSPPHFFSNGISEEDIYKLYSIYGFPFSNLGFSHWSCVNLILRRVPLRKLMYRDKLIVNIVEGHVAEGTTHIEWNKFKVLSTKIKTTFGLVTWEEEVLMDREGQGQKKKGAKWHMTVTCR